MIYSTQLRRQKAAVNLASDLARHGPKIAKALEPRMAAVLEEGEQMPDVAHLLDVLGRVLALESQGLETTAHARSVEGTQVAQARKALCESAVPELRQRVIWVRNQVCGAYGAKEAERLLGHKGRTPRAREALQELAEHMVSFLPQAEPPEAIAGPPPKPADWADHLRPALAEFNHHMDELERHGGGQKEVVGKKNQALATFDRNYSRIVRLAMLFYELADQESLTEYLKYQPWRYTGGRPKEQVLPESAERQRTRGPGSPTAA